MPIRYTLLDSGFALEDPSTWNIKDNVQISKILNPKLTQDLEADFSNSEHCYEGVKIKRKLSTKLFLVSYRVERCIRGTCSSIQNRKARFLMLKSFNETRWSERADVLRAQVTSRNEIKNDIEDLIEDNTQTPDTRVTVEGFRKILEIFRPLYKW
ncbi:hypothetical protein TNCT_9001 [Trichonephila clavata]|uniref:Uncharacterized protein n=1 Tax=Trichonephila clavata TaxID=2740835 RepID=A0A8X6GBN5_TRICU|nr:hypothetical protein TNCT_9001 [Trichonephila clavata]